MSRFKSNFKETIEKAKQTLEGTNNKDERFWYSTHDRGKDCLVELRLMPSKPKGSSYGELCYIKEDIHNFKYIDRNGRKKHLWTPCAKRLNGEECPICDVVSELWEKDKDTAQEFTPEDKALRTLLGLKEHFVCNILIVDDPTNPENNGKIFMTKFPAKGTSVIFTDKILRELNPSDSNKKKKNFKQINPFEPYDVDKDILPGANFYYDYKAPGKGESYGNYNSSEFIKDDCGAVYEDESKIDDAMDKLFDLSAYLDELREKIVPYDEIIEKVGHVLNGEGGSVTVEKEDISDDEIFGDMDNDKDEKIVEDDKEDSKEEDIEEKIPEIKKEEKKASKKEETEKDDLDKELEDWDD